MRLSILASLLLVRCAAQPPATPERAPAETDVAAASTGAQEAAEDSTDSALMPEPPRVSAAVDLAAISDFLAETPDGPPARRAYLTALLRAPDGRIPDETENGRTAYGEERADAVKAAASAVRVTSLKNTYARAYDLLSLEQRRVTALEAPDSLTLDDEARKQALQRITRYLPIWERDGISEKPMPKVKCDEVGFGSGSDMGAGSEFAAICPPLENGLIGSSVSWPQKPHLTCVRDQGNRGTCTAFALSAALETFVGQHQQTRINLSEQALYAKAKRDWSPSCQDGLNAGIALSGLVSTGFSLPYESGWLYNPSYQRKLKTCDVAFFLSSEEQNYSGSCAGYDGPQASYCSDTVHQSRIDCAGKTCTFSVPATNDGYRVTGFEPIADNDFATWPNISIRLHLMAGHPVVIGVNVVALGTGDNAKGGYLHAPKILPIPSLATHAMAIVGFVPAAALPVNAPMTSGSGYFVIKNSWGECYGDQGYIYVDDGWLDYYMLDGYALTGVASPP